MSHLAPAAPMLPPRERFGRFVLAAGRDEADRVAKQLGLKQWVYLAPAYSGHALRGQSRPTVYATACWYHGVGAAAVERMRDSLRIAQASVVDVPCPPGRR